MQLYVPYLLHTRILSINSVDGRDGTSNWIQRSTMQYMYEWAGGRLCPLKTGRLCPSKPDRLCPSNPYSTVEKRRQDSC